MAIDPLSKWGFNVKVWTASHHIHKWPRFGAVVPYGVRVDAHAWIGSCAVLAGCHIGTRAIVAVGAVVVVIGWAEAATGSGGHASTTTTRSVSGFA